MRPAPTPAGPSFVKVAFLNLPGEGNWQGAALTGGYWWAVEARKQSDGSEDCYVYRARAGGGNAPKAAPKHPNVTSWEPPMRVNAGPGGKVHPTGWDVAPAGVVLLTTNEGGNQVTAFDYRAGHSVAKAQGRAHQLFTRSNAQVAVDPTDQRVSVRTITTETDTHVLRASADVAAGVNRVLGTVRIPRHDRRVVQGFTLAEHEGRWELRVLVGLKSARSPFGVERWDAVTGAHIVTDPIPDGLGREPEGTEGDLVFMKTDDRSGLDAYRFTPSTTRKANS